MRRWSLPVFATIAAVALIVIALTHGNDAARGWLFGFVLIEMVPVGSLALLLVHGITGGRWCRDLAPVLIAAARCLPLLVLLFLPVAIFRPAIYDWQSIDLPADVLAHYLTPGFFDARTLGALAIWSGMVWTQAWRRPLWAGLGLAVHLVLLTFLPADWVLTLFPSATSAGFGLGFGIEQIFAALAFAAIIAPQGIEPRANSDLAGMIVSALLGTVYFVYMQFIVTWYGNIPSHVHVYVLRAEGVWSAVAFAAFLIGAACPFLAILSPAVRHNPQALRIVGMLVLIGVLLHLAWLIVPAFGVGPIAPAVLATAFMSASLLVVSRIGVLREAR